MNNMLQRGDNLQKRFKLSKAYLAIYKTWWRLMAPNLVHITLMFWTIKRQRKKGWDFSPILDRLRDGYIRPLSLQRCSSDRQETTQTSIILVNFWGWFVSVLGSSKVLGHPCKYLASQIFSQESDGDKYKRLGFDYDFSQICITSCSRYTVYGHVQQVLTIYSI